MRVPDEMVQDVIEQLEGFPFNRKRVRACLENVLRPYPEPTHELQAINTAWQSELSENRRLRKQKLSLLALLLLNAVVLVAIATGSIS